MSLDNYKPYACNDADIIVMVSKAHYPIKSNSKISTIHTSTSYSAAKNVLKNWQIVHDHRSIEVQLFSPS